MNRVRILASILVITAQAPSVAATPEQRQEARIDALFPRFDAKTPGCAVGVERDGKTLFAKGYGAADIESGRPLTPQTRVSMQSISKQFAAMAVLLLVEDGKIGLDDPIRTFLPELPSYANAVTIRHLLTQTGGLRDFYTLSLLNGTPGGPYTEASVMALLSRQEGPSSQPGAVFLYANANYDLLSIIVQRVSKMRLDDFARSRIFTPLGMTSSLFRHDHTNPIPDMANGYVSRPGGGWQVANDDRDFVGGNGLYSTVDDMLRWLGNLSSLKIGAKAVPLMTTSAKLNNGSLTGYGMGLVLSPSTYRGLPLVQHGGSGAGYRLNVWWFPQQRFGIAMLCNQLMPPDLSGRIAAIFLESEMKPATSADALRFDYAMNRRISPERKDTRKIGIEAGMEFVGDYGSQEVSNPVQVRWLEGLVLLSSWGWGGPLVEIGPDRLWDAKTYTELVFRRDAAGRVSGLILNTAGARGINFVIKPGPKPISRSASDLPRAQLDRVIGTYQFGPDADNLLLTVTRQGNQLFEQLTGQRRDPIFAEAPLTFFQQAVDARWRFVADINGKVTAVVLIQDGRERTGPRVLP